MKKLIALYAIIAAALVAAPVGIRAADTHAKGDESSEAGAPAAKKHRHLPFHGKAAAVDTSAKTVKVGHMVIHINSDTKITNKGKPATLSDITVGEKISGSYEKDDAGKMTAVLIHVGGKAKGEKEKAEKH